jgi:diadenosine tetraphosphate (Ap4A) HIT family hydrolase
MYRSRTQHQNYLRYLAEISEADKRPPKSCTFCEIKEGYPQFVRTTVHFKIIRNIFPYSIWDYMHVTDHLLIIPIKHTDDLAKLSKDAAAEFVQLLSQYESEGYDLYARSTSSKGRSITHQHTHLIKCDGKITKTSFYLRKPYVNIAL